MNISVNYTILLVYALICAEEDLRTRQISIYLSVAFGIAGAVLCLARGREPAELLSALLPCAAMTVISLLTRGSLGAGDALFAGVCALFLPVREMIYVVLVSLWLSGMAALVIVASGMITAGSRRNAAIPVCGGASGRNRKGAVRTIPYITVMLVPIVWIAVNRLILNQS